MLGVGFMQDSGATMNFERDEVRHKKNGRTVIILLRTSGGSNRARVAAARMISKVNIAGGTLTSVEVSVTAKYGELVCSFRR